jgi:hypothetical protein
LVWIQIEVEDGPSAPPDEHHESAHNQHAEEAVQNIEGRLSGPLHNKNTLHDAFPRCELHIEKPLSF